MKIGPRIIKTGIAVTITMFIASKLKWEPALFGAVSAIINMQPSLPLTFKTARTQILIHFLGVLTGVIMGYLFGGNPITMGLTVMFIIVLYNKLRLQSGILMGVVAAIFILGSAPEQFFQHAISRSLVIFTGLTVAMFVNVLLWPPKYSKQYIEKLNHTNQEAVVYFCQAIYDFAAVGNQESLDYENRPQRHKVLALIDEAEQLAEHFRGEMANTNLNSLNSNNAYEVQDVEKFLSYNKLIIDKADRIYELMPARLERRLKYSAPPVSREFADILEIVKEGCPTIHRVNDKLRGIILGNQKGEREEIDQVYWDRMTEAVEEWQQRLTNSYYLHALLEVAVVVNEMRWVAQEGKKIINSALTDKVRGV